ncbi:MAG: PLD nuclease N-terminal domain-containing protein [Anaerolineae bacterium]
MTEEKTKPSASKKPSALKIVNGLVRGAINAALVIWTLYDIRQRSDAELNGKRNVWLIAAFAPPIGPIAYLLFGRKRDTEAIEVQPETPEAA